MSNDNHQFTKIDSSTTLLSFTPGEAKEELEDIIDYSLLVVKLKGEEDPRSFDLRGDPELRNHILALMINKDER